MKTAEQQARDMLERMGVEDAQSFSSGDLVELANLIAERDALRTGLVFHETPQGFQFVTYGGGSGGGPGGAARGSAGHSSVRTNITAEALDDLRQALAARKARRWWNWWRP